MTDLTEHELRMQAIAVAGEAAAVICGILRGNDELIADALQTWGGITATDGGSSPRTARAIAMITFMTEVIQGRESAEDVTDLLYPMLMGDLQSE